MGFPTFKVALLTVVIALLAGCQTTQGSGPGQKPYWAPTPTGETATVSGNLIARDGLLSMMGLSVIAVDGGKLNNFWTTTHKVPTGQHRYKIAATFSKGLFQGNYTGEAEASASLKPGRRYVPAGKPEGDKLLVWLEDKETGKRVSTIGSTPYRVAPIDYVVVY